MPRFTPPQPSRFTRRSFLIGSGVTAAGLALYAGEFARHEIDIVERPIQSDDPYDFGSDPMVQDVRRLVQSQPRLAFQIKPPPEAILFYRAATGLAHDLRLLKVRGRFRPILRDIQERGRLE